jgi:hypothetical protein
MKVTFKKDWFFGGDKKDENGISDWVRGYKASNGKYIEVGKTMSSYRWYEVDGKSFGTLKEAKKYCEEA